ncbi:MAG: glycine zipper domain-containing protein [Candidatus Binatia bacterium]
MPGSATFAEIDEQLRSFVHERPFVAVAAAVAAGFILGRILSRT